MSGSVRTEIGIGAAGACLVAESSAEVESTISEIARSSMPDEEGRYVEEFTLNGGNSLEDTDVDEVFSSGAHTVYQFEPNSDGACVCRTIESFGCPISNLHARDGTLYVSFHAPDIETVQNIVGELQERYEDVHVRHLARAHDSSSNTDFVFVDRGRLTEKQREVLETAHEMGYFDHPKGANSEEVADELGISPSTFCEHLAAAQRKVLDGLLRS